MHQNIAVHQILKVWIMSAYKEAVAIILKNKVALIEYYVVMIMLSVIQIHNVYLKKHIY